MMIGVEIEIISLCNYAFNFHFKNLNQVLSIDEIHQMKNCDNKNQFILKRVAAKNAFIKLIKNKLNKEILPQDLYIQHDANGKPFLRFGNNTKELLSQIGDISVHLSLSDTKSHVAALVVVDIG